MGSKNMRRELSELDGMDVSCEGVFSDVRYLHDGFVSLLFRDVVVDNRHCYDHMWIIHNEHFQGIGMKPGCRVAFRGVVQKYSGGEEKYGLSFCHDAVVMKRDFKAEDAAFSNMCIKFKTINYNGKKYAPKDDMKGYKKFAEDYEIPGRFKARLVYSPVQTLKNSMGEIEFDVYDEDGKMAEFDKVSFSPVADGHKISIDDKYYLGIGEETYRRISLIYYMVRNSQDGCMAYIPSDVLSDYAGVVSNDGTDFYYKGGLVCSVNRNVADAALEKGGITCGREG